MKKSTMTAAVMAAMVAAGVATVPVTAHAAEAPATKYTAAQQAAFKAIFNAEDYASMYPDVAAAFGDDADLLFSHFLLFGISEGRAPSASFNVNAYASAYPDLQAAYGDTTENYYLHYITCGAKEGRDITSISTALKKGKTVYTVSSFEDGIQGPVKAKQQIIAAPNVYRAIAQATSSYTAEAKKDEAKKDEVKPEITVSNLDKWIDQMFNWMLAGSKGDAPAMSDVAKEELGEKLEAKQQEYFDIWQAGAEELIEYDVSTKSQFYSDAIAYENALKAFDKAVEEAKEQYDFNDKYTITDDAYSKVALVKPTETAAKAATYYVDEADEDGNHKASAVEKDAALTAWQKTLFNQHKDALNGNDFEKDAYYKKYAPVLVTDDDENNNNKDHVGEYKVGEKYYSNYKEAQQAAVEAAIEALGTSESNVSDAVKSEAGKLLEDKKYTATEAKEAYWTVEGCTTESDDGVDVLVEFESEEDANKAANQLQIDQTKEKFTDAAPKIHYTDEENKVDYSKPAELKADNDGKYNSTYKYLTAESKKALKAYYDDTASPEKATLSDVTNIKEKLDALDTDKYEIKVDGANYQEDTVITAENINKITITEKKLEQ